MGDKSTFNLHSDPADFFRRAGGALEQPETLGSRDIPAVVAAAEDADALLWSNRDANGEIVVKRVTSDRPMLDRFLRLADERNPQRFVRFAQRWGTLTCDQYSLREDALIAKRESLDQWRAEAVRMRAALAVARCLGDGQVAPLDILGTALGEPGQGQTAVTNEWTTTLKGQRALLQMRLAMWLQDAKAGIFIDLIHHTPPRLTIVTAGLWGDLVVYLVGVIAGVAIPVFCAGCGRLFDPRRPTPEGQQPYCDDPTCRTLAKNAAQRRWRHRVAESKALQRKGRSDG